MILCRHLLICLLWLGAFAQAQTDWRPPLPGGAQAIRTEGELAQVIATASSEVMLSAPLLRSRALADALRLAITERGVAVFILAPTEGAEDPASYFMSLALTGAALSVAPSEEAFLIVDRLTLVTGPMVSGIKQLPGQSAEPTYYINDSGQAAPFVASFYESYSRAETYDTESFIQSMQDQVIQEMGFGLSQDPAEEP